jgi:GxxExxY protein
MFASQNQIGRLADERIYQADVAERLESVSIPSHLEVPVELVHRTFEKTLYLDLVVSQRAVYELKTVSTLTKNHVAQLLTYLYLLDLPRGKLVNFRSTTVESQFVNAPIPREERCGFSVSDDRYQGDRSLIKLVVDLVRDWGTSLSVSLYHEAIVHLLGGVASVKRMLPLTCNGRHLGNQRFHLVADDTAFEVTAFANLDNDFHKQLQRLISLSTLRAIQWINIGPHCVTSRTIKAT